MARKKDVVKKIDIKTRASGAPLPLIQEDQPAPPAFYVIPAPDTLVELGQAIVRSTQAALVSVALGWQEAPNIAPDYYNVEWSESSSFTDVQRKRASTTSATIEGLKANGITYYFRVQAVLGGIYSPFSDTLSVLTMTDNTPPPDVTGASAAFQNSDLVITYTIPTSEILKDVKIEIYNAAHTILYGTFYTTSPRFVWTAEQNIFATGGVPLTSVSIDIHTRSWLNFLSTTGVNITATAPLPSTPTGYVSNWISDTGVAAADFITSWLGAAHAFDYQLTIDGKDYYTRDLKFVYSYEQNVSDHSPTLASGDPSFVWLLKARDKLGQSSTPVNVTVTNAAPPSGVMTLTINPGFSTLGVTVGILANTIVQDFDHYEWKVWNGTTFVRTINSPDPSVIFDLSTFGPGTYTPSVTMVDKFNQRSATVSGAPQILDTLTIEQLRSEALYTDDVGNSQSTLNNLKDDDAATTVTYAGTGSGVWHYTKIERPTIDRYGAISLVVSSGAAKMYVGISTDDITYTWYSGPLTGTFSSKLTLVANEAAAQTASIVIDTTSLGRYDIPTIKDARYIKVFHRAAVSYTLSTLYPRRIVQSDDVDTESLSSINIRAAGINADRIFVTSLSAFTASMGSLHIDSLLDIASAGIIFQGTGTGTLAQNAATPTSFNVTGLKIYNSSGVGKLSTYNTGVEQITLDTDGKLKWAAGAGVMDAGGIKITVGSVLDAVKAYLFKDGSNNTVGGMYGFANSGNPSVEIHASSIASKASNVNIQSNTPNGLLSSITLTVKSGLVFYPAFTASTDGTTNSIKIDALTTSGSIWLSSPTRISETLKVDSNVSVGANTAATRNLSIFADNGYISWNNAAGTEKWVAGLETSNSGSFALYSSAASVYPLIINSAGDTATFVGNTITSSGLELNSVASGNRTTTIDLHGDNTYTDYGLRIIREGSGANTNSGISHRGTGIFYISLPEAGSIGFYTSNTERVTIGSAGNMAIAQKLYIGNTSTVPTALIHLASDSALKPTTTTWQTTSTKDAKDNIKTRKDALSRIKQLRLADFDYNGKYHTEKGAKGVGFIAEEAKLIYPNAVQEIRYVDENEVEQRFLALNPHEIFMDYAVAIQELIAEIESLKSKVGK